MCLKRYREEFEEELAQRRREASAEEAIWIRSRGSSEWSGSDTWGNHRLVARSGVVSLHEQDKERCWIESLPFVSWEPPQTGCLSIHDRVVAASHDLMRTGLQHIDEELLRTIQEIMGEVVPDRNLLRKEFLYFYDFLKRHVENHNITGVVDSLRYQAMGDEGARLRIQQLDNPVVANEMVVEGVIGREEVVAEEIIAEEITAEGVENGIARAEMK